MATTSRNPHNSIKSTQVKSATHIEILTVGNKVFEKEKQNKKCFLEEELLKREEKIITQLENEHLQNIQKLEKQHKDELESFKVHYLKLQNDALKEEASRVKDIMNKVAKDLVDKTILEGQKKLDDALVVAAEEFTHKKEQQIKQVVTEQQAITAEKLKQKEAEHQKHIDKLNEEYQRKLRKQSNEFSKALETKLSEEKRRLREQFDVKLKTALDAANDKHTRHVNELNIEIQREKNEKEDLKKEIESLENNLNEMNVHLKKVMSSFQRFVNATPGFYEGQAEFLLQDLIPLSTD